MVVNRPRTSSPVNQQQHQQAPNHMQSLDDTNKYNDRNSKKYDQQHHPPNHGIEASDKYSNVNDYDNRQRMSSFQKTPRMAPLPQLQSQKSLHMTSPPDSRLGYQQQRQHEPVSLLYQDLDDVIDEQGALVTSVGTMETSYLSEKSGKDVQLTHFIETVSVFFFTCTILLNVVLTQFECYIDVRVILNV